MYRGDNSISSIFFPTGIGQLQDLGSLSCLFSMIYHDLLQSSLAFGRGIQNSLIQDIC